MEEIYALERILDRKYGRNAKKYLGSPEYQELQKLIAEKQQWCIENGLSYYQEYTKDEN